MRPRRIFGRAGAATAPIALAFVALAAVEVSYFPGRDSTLHEAALRTKAVALAELTASSVVPALEFEDEAVLSEFLSSVARDKQVSRALACAHDGTVKRSVGMAATAHCQVVSKTLVEMDQHELRVLTPLAAKSHPGTLLLAFRTEAIAQARRDSERVAGGIALGILLLGFAVAWWSGRILRRLHSLVEENREARRRAEAASAAKSAFLANMSHEIRTPMNGVIGVTQLLEKTPLDAAQRQHVQTIARSGELLLAIINDILDFSKVEAGKLAIVTEPVVLSELAGDLQAALAPVAQEKGLLLRCQVSPELPPRILGDGVRLRQILLNLLSNALKFTERGEVVLQIAPDSRSGQLRFSVRDTGIGISASHAATLFDAFTQVDEHSTRRYGGTGLGLAICKRLVELMSGKIGFESEPGRGSTFWCVVPLVAARTSDAAEPAPSRPDSGPVASGLRVLAVDDNEINRGVMEHMARELGYAIDVIESGREAVDRIKSGQRYAVILMDCQMPEVDGYMATREIRSWEELQGSARVPIVAVTAHAMQEEAARVRAAGMDDYLAKPVRLSALRQTIDKWLPAQDPESRSAS